MQTRSILGVYFTHLHISKIRYTCCLSELSKNEITTVFTCHLTQPFA